jgi:hypothetical protein
MAPPIYILVAFVAFPGLCLCVALAIKASVAGGICLLFIVLVALLLVIVWWIHGWPCLPEPFSAPICYKVLSEERRKELQEEMATLEESSDATGTNPAEDQDKPKQDGNKVEAV